jgi:hypothetical protein
MSGADPIGPGGLFWAVDKLGHFSAVLAPTWRWPRSTPSRPRSWTAWATTRRRSGRPGSRSGRPGHLARRDDQRTVQYLHSEVAYARWVPRRPRAHDRRRPARDGRNAPGSGFELVEGLFLMVLITGAASRSSRCSTSAADEWSQSIITNALHGGDFGRNIGEMLKLSGPALGRSSRSCSGWSRCS